MSKPVAVASQFSVELRHDLVTPAMLAAVGRELDRRRSFPIAASDIRKWLLAIYYPELPPQTVWNDLGVDALRLVAPEDFNPFAWWVAEPLGPPKVLQDPEEVLGLPGLSFNHRIRSDMRATYGVPMYAGDVITSVRALAEYEERSGRRGLRLATSIVDEWTNQHGDLVKRLTFTFLRY